MVTKVKSIYSINSQTLVPFEANLFETYFLILRKDRVPISN